MIVLLARAVDTPGFARSLDFVFGPHAEDLTPRGVLEALGHSFFTLSLGMGCMITYGSYLRQREDIVFTSTTVSVLDTVISLMACLMVFPIIFSFGLAPGAGPGLVFVSVPIAFAQMPLGAMWAALFFVLLAIAALGSTISLLEVPVSHLIDERRMQRRRAALLVGAIIFGVGVPSALSGGELFGKGVQSLTAAVFGGNGKNWFDTVDYLASNWMLPLGGLGIAHFVAWRVGAAAREHGFKSGSRWAQLYWTWVWLLRYLVPIAIVAVFLHAIGII
jgi:NSS family neurotransmitter:Na+ symporter